MPVDIKQVIHVVCEVLVLLGVSIYFNQRIKIVNICYEELKNRVEEQDKIIERQEKMILNLMNTMNGVVNELQNRNSSYHPSFNKPTGHYIPIPSPMPTFPPKTIPESIPETILEHENENTIEEDTTEIDNEIDKLVENELCESELTPISDGHIVYSMETPQMSTTTFHVFVPPQHIVQNSEVKVEEIIDDNTEEVSQKTKTKNKNKNKNKNKKPSPISPALSEDLDKELAAELKELEKED